MKHLVPILSSLVAAVQLLCVSASAQTLSEEQIRAGYAANQAYAAECNFGRLKQDWPCITNVRQLFKDGVVYIMHNDGSAAAANVGQNQHNSIGEVVIKDRVYTQDILSRDPSNEFVTENGGPGKYLYNDHNGNAFNYEARDSFYETSFEVVGVDQWSFTQNFGITSFEFPTTLRYMACGAICNAEQCLTLTFNSPYPPELECKCDVMPLQNLRNLQTIYVPAGSEKVYFEALTKCGDLGGTIHPNLHINEGEVVPDADGDGIPEFEEKPAEKAETTITWNGGTNKPAGTTEVVPGAIVPEGTTPIYTSSNPGIVKVVGVDPQTGDVTLEYVTEGQATITVTTKETDKQKPGKTEVTYTVKLREATITWPVGTTVYVGETRTFKGAQANTSGAISYASKNNALMQYVSTNSDKTVTLKFIKVGDVQGTATVAATKTYDKASTSTTFNIVKRTRVIDWSNVFGDEGAITRYVFTSEVVEGPKGLEDGAKLTVTGNNRYCAATVQSDGKVKFDFKEEGKATLTFTVDATNEYDAASTTLNVNVIKHTPVITWEYGGKKPAGTTENVVGATIESDGVPVYSSSNSAVARVQNVNGKADGTVDVRYGAEGKAIVSVYTPATKNYYASKPVPCEVTVVKEDTKPSWNPDNGGEKPAGEKETVPCAEDLGDAQAQYVSTNANVVRVVKDAEGNCVIEYVGPGEACITVKTAETATRHATESDPICFKVVKQQPSITWNVPGDLKVAKTSEVVPGAVTKSDGKITYTSSDPSVIKVQTTNDGRVLLTYLKEGTATVSASVAESANFLPAGPAAHELEVVAQKTNLDWGNEGDQFKDPILACSAPITINGVTNTGDAQPEYKSSDEGIVKVAKNQDGTVTLEFVSEGEVTITASTPKTATQEAGSATIKITVEKCNANLTWIEGFTATATETESKPAATSESDGKITYVSSNEKVVKVTDNGDGTVTFEYVGKGEATVTATQEATPKYNAPTPVVITVSVDANKPGTTWTPGDNGGDKFTDDPDEVLPKVENPGDGEPEYKSDNEDVVKVTTDPEGNPHVEIVGEGDACITVSMPATATQEAWTSDQKVCYHVVKHTAEIEWPYAGGDVFVGYNVSDAPAATVTPGAGKVSYKSSDESVVKVSENPDGTLSIEYLKEGTATLTAFNEANDDFYAAEPVSKTVTVGKFPNTITWQPETGDNYVGDEPETVPGAETDGEGKPEYSSSDEEVVKVTVDPQTGDVTLEYVGEGEAEIIVTTPDTPSESGDEVRVPITVKKHDATLEWNAPNGPKDAGSTEVIPAPKTNSDGEVKITTSDPQACIVIENNDGSLTVVYIKGGESTITATVEPTAKYNAPDPVSGTVTVGRKDITPTWNPGIEGGDRDKGTEDENINKPDGTGDAQYEYESSNPDVVKVVTNPDGTTDFEYVGDGDACISLVVKESDTQNAARLEDVICFHVTTPATPEGEKVPVESITVSDQNGNTGKIVIDDAIDPEDEPQLTATVKPDTATEKDVTWSSSDERVAIVDENGHVSVVGPGTTTITATAKDGSGTTGTIEVKVQQTQHMTWPKDVIYYEDDMVKIPSYTEEGAELKYEPADEKSKGKFEIFTNTDGETFVHFLEKSDEVNIKATTIDRNPDLKPFSDTWSVVVLEKKDGKKDVKPAEEPAEDAQEGDGKGTSAVKVVNSDAAKTIDVKIVGDMIEVTGAPADAQMIVYDLTGKAIYTGPAANLFITERGIHLISIDGEVFKVRN